MDEILEMGRQVLASQPFSVWIKAELISFSEGKAELAIPITDHLKQQYGYLHGGVLSYAADNAMTFAGGSVLGPLVITVEYKINYLRPASGERLVARASVIHAGKR
ncbi:MAG: PaaI family thioesterase [Anaerolineales bacterium]